MTQTSTPSSPAAITVTLVPDNRRVALTAQLFGIFFPLRLEPTVFGIASRLCLDYHGGFWRFMALSNGGFYMAPESDRTFHLACDNGFDGELSSDALGITVCLYAYSHLSFRGDDFAALCAEHYHLLRAFALDHEEASQVMAATD